MAVSPSTASLLAAWRRRSARRRRCRRSAPASVAPATDFGRAPISQSASASRGRDLDPFRDGHGRGKGPRRGSWARSSFHPVDAAGKADTQLEQVQGLLDAGVDALVVVPVDAAATNPIRDLAAAAGVPLVWAQPPAVRPRPGRLTPFVRLRLAPGRDARDAGARGPDRRPGWRGDPDGRPAHRGGGRPDRGLQGRRRALPRISASPARRWRAAAAPCARGGHGLALRPERQDRRDLRERRQAGLGASRA